MDYNKLLNEYLSYKNSIKERNRNAYIRAPKNDEDGSKKNMENFIMLIFLLVFGGVVVAGMFGSIKAVIVYGIVAVAIYTKSYFSRYLEKEIRYTESDVVKLANLITLSKCVDVLLFIIFIPLICSAFILKAGIIVSSGMFLTGDDTVDRKVLYAIPSLLLILVWVGVSIYMVNVIKKYFAFKKLFDLQKRIEEEDIENQEMYIMPVEREVPQTSKNEGLVPACLIVFGISLLSAILGILIVLI